VLDRGSSKRVIKLNGLVGSNSHLVLGSFRSKPEVDVPFETRRGFFGLFQNAKRKKKRNEERRSIGEKKKARKKKKERKETGGDGRWRKKECYVKDDVGITGMEFSELRGVGDLDYLQLFNAPDFETPVDFVEIIPKRAKGRKKREREKRKKGKGKRKKGQRKVKKEKRV